MTELAQHRALSDLGARQLANATKSAPKLDTISPRWLTHLLQWLPVEAGIYRLNRVKNPEAVLVTCTNRGDESELPSTYVDYEESPREYFLNGVSTVLDVHTRVSDLYNSPFDQIKEQLRLTIETIKEKQESELINNPDYGLLASVHPDQIVYPLTGAPTPDKIFGPTGIGAVYGRRDVLEDLPPYQGGGNMIQDVTFEKTVYHGPPTRFEAGTGNIADAVGLGAALDYVERIGIENIGRYEHDLLAYATHHLQPIPGVRLIGAARDKASVLSFVLDGYTTDEVGQALNREGIAVRTGHHCAQPILRRFGLESTVRPSLAFYNTCEEVDRFIAVVQSLARRRR